LFWIPDESLFLERCNYVLKLKGKYRSGLVAYCLVFTAPSYIFLPASSISWDRKTVDKCGKNTGTLKNGLLRLSVVKFGMCD